MTPMWHGLARWLLDEELGGRRGDEALIDAAERASRKLCGRLASLITVDGYRALLTRALHVSVGEFPFLQGVRAGATDDVGFEGLREKTKGIDTAMLCPALATVLGSVLGLLATFIGEDIAVRLVRDVWPGAPLNTIDPDHAGEVRP